MQFILCYKLTPDPNTIEVKPSGKLDFSQADWVVGDFEFTAQEAAVQLAAACGATVKGISVGGEALSNTKAQKSVLARGCTELLLVKDETYTQADSHQTACVLAAAIQKQGEHDLVVCGEGSSDLYFQQVGIQLGELLDVPVINGISKLIGIQNGVLTAERTVGNTVDTLEIPLPAVICAKSDICQAKVPTMKEILAAGKKPVTVWSSEEIGSTENPTELISVLAPKSVERKRIAITGTPEEMADGLIAALASNALL